MNEKQKPGFGIVMVHYAPQAWRVLTAYTVPTKKLHLKEWRLDRVLSCAVGKMDKAAHRWHKFGRHTE